MIWLFSSLFRFGFEFNLLVLGEQGLGKQTFINSLFKVDWGEVLGRLEGVLVKLGELREFLVELGDFGRVGRVLVELGEFW